MRSCGGALVGHKHDHLKSRDRNAYIEVTDACVFPGGLGEAEGEALGVLGAVVERRTQGRWASGGNMALGERYISPFNM